MKKFCKNCSHWEQDYPNNTGLCTSDMFTNSFYENIKLDGCGYYNDYESRKRIYLETGGNFGCVNFADRL